MNIYNILFINFLFQKNGYVIKNFQLKNSDYERQNNVYVKYTYVYVYITLTLYMEPRSTPRLFLWK